MTLITVDQFHAVTTTAACEYSIRDIDNPQDRAVRVAQAINEASVAAVQQAREQLRESLKGATCTILATSVTPTIGNGFAVAVCLITYIRGKILSGAGLHEA